MEDNGSVKFLTEVTAPDASNGDSFGISVSQSGNILAVGTYLSDPDGLSNAGAAYLYQLETNGTVTFLSKITAPDKAANDHFWWSVSQSGNILAVGTYLSDPDGLSNAGAAYIYQLETDGTVTFLSKITAPDKMADDYFGWSVAQNGNVIVVGSNKLDPNNIIDAGAAYLYELDDNGTVVFQQVNLAK